MNDIIECSTCGRWFPDIDGTRTCPNGGHENPASDFLPPQKVQG